MNSYGLNQTFIQLIYREDLVKKIANCLVGFPDTAFSHERISLWFAYIYKFSQFGGLESVRIGKCQNPLFARFGRNWKVSELESVRIGKCQNWKVSESESVRIGNCQNWKLSELETVRIGKCQNWKVSELESVRIFLKLKDSL